MGVYERNRDPLVPGRDGYVVNVLGLVTVL